MRGHSPLGWAAVLLIVVAYAHVILEIAVALLAIALAGRVIMSPGPALLVARLARQVRRQRAVRHLARRRAGLEATADRSREQERAESER